MGLATPGLVAERITDLARLEAIAEPWWQLWGELARPLPFLTPAWLLPWWRHFRPGELASVAIWCGERLVALAPCYLEDGAWGRRLLPIGISLSDYLDILVAPDSPEALTLLADVLPAVMPRLAAISLEDLPAHATALHLPVAPRWREETGPQSCSPILALRRGEGGLAAVPARKRRALRMARHRAERRGACLATEGLATLPAALEALLRLHAARWQERGEPGLLADARVPALLREAVPALAAAGLVRLYTLKLAGVVAGAYLGFAQPGHAYAYFGGFDPAFAFESPGTVLMGHAISEAAAEGATQFHFLRGDEAYKFDWGAKAHSTWRRVLRRPA